MLPAEYRRHRPVPSTSSPCRAWWGRFWRPFFRRGEATVDEALVPADLLPIVELVEERAPQGQEDATLFPLSEPAPTGGGTAVSWRGVAPRGARPKHPEGSPPTPAPDRPPPAPPPAVASPRPEQATA